MKSVYSYFADEEREALLGGGEPQEESAFTHCCTWSNFRKQNWGVRSFRMVSAVYLFAVFAFALYNNFSTQGATAAGRFFLKLSNYYFLFTAVYFLSASATAGTTTVDDIPSNELNFAHKLTALLFETVWSWSFVLSIMYWVLNFPFAPYSTWNFSEWFLQINFNIVALVMIFVDFWFNSFNFHLSHAIVPLLVTLSLWLIFGVVQLITDSVPKPTQRGISEVVMTSVALLGFISFILGASMVQCRNRGCQSQPSEAKLP